MPAMPSRAAPRISLIAAVARNGVIGLENRLPWRLPEDLAHFKATTLGHPVVMGRKTFESLGRPLPGRHNVVVTREPGRLAASLLEGSYPMGTSVQAVSSIQEALDAAGGALEVFFVGGADLYAQILPLADRLYLTEVDIAPDGDARFPEFDRSVFRETARTWHQGVKGDPLRFDFVVYERRV